MLMEEVCLRSGRAEKSCAAVNSASGDTFTVHFLSLIRNIDSFNLCPQKLIKYQKVHYRISTFNYLYFTELFDDVSLSFFLGQY